MSTDPTPTRGGETSSIDVQPVRGRRRRQLSVVAVAAAVLLAGGGGAYWATTAGNSEDAAGQGSASKPPKLALDGLAAGQHSGEDGKDGPGIAPGEPHPQTYKANKKLPDGPDAASVYRTPASVPRGSVAALAESLDVPGTPKKKDGRWLVSEDGKSQDGVTLTVNDDRLAGNWTYQTQDSPVMPCGKPLPTVPNGDAVAPDSPDAPDSCPQVPGSGKGDPVSEKKAKSAVKPVLETLKLTDAELDASVTTGSMRMVSATPQVDGMPTKDWNNTFTVDEDGKVVRGHGNLGKLERGASYPVMTADETLSHLNKHGKGGAAVREPAPAPPSGKDGVKADGKGDDKGGKPGQIAPGEPMKVTDAEFGLVTRYSLGKPVLVPSWIYQVELGGGQHTASISHPAVQPEYLKPTRPSQTGPGSEDPGSGTGSGPAPGSGSGSGQEEKPGSAPIQAVNSYKADGRTVKLTFWGGVCGGYKASAEESGKSVKVTVRPKETDPKKVCVKMAKKQTIEIELDKALGDRKLLDAQDGEGLPRAK